MFIWYAGEKSFFHKGNFCRLYRGSCESSKTKKMQIFFTDFKVRHSCDDNSYKDLTSGEKYAIDNFKVCLYDIRLGIVDGM